MRCMCILCGEDYLDHQCILAEVERKRGLCLNCWNKCKNGWYKLKKEVK